MPRSRYRKGRKDHNRRVKAHRIKHQQELLAAGRAILERFARRSQPQHDYLIPTVDDAVNG